MDDFEEKLVHGSEDELNELKSWLFRENIRLITLSKELEEREKKFIDERSQFQEEMKTLNHKISSERQRLKQDMDFFDKKMEILQSGFQQLDIDRRRLEKEWSKLEAMKELNDKEQMYGSYMDVSVFFMGVKNPLALKKRYKDLIKIFHPDNVAGDKDIIQRINAEYEMLKASYENDKEA